jgi:hypothetical protein
VCCMPIVSDYPLAIRSTDGELKPNRLDINDQMLQHLWGCDRCLLYIVSPKHILYCLILDGLQRC